MARMRLEKLVSIHLDIGQGNTLFSICSSPLPEWTPSLLLNLASKLQLWDVSLIIQLCQCAASLTNRMFDYQIPVVVSRKLHVSSEEQVLQHIICSP